jgi:rubrerythrin
MNVITQVLHLIGSGAVAYITARNLHDRRTRPDLLAGFHLAEAGSVPFLEALSQRAMAEGNTWLAEKLSRHAQDERRHGQIFAHALKQLNKQAIDFRSMPERNTESEKRRSPFFEAYYEGYSRESLKAEQIDWTVFFASTHILELDAHRDFIRMANTLPETDPVNANLRKGLLSIAKDEQGHAAYLLEALHRQLPYADVITLVDQWRTRKVNALLAMASNLLQKGGQLPAMSRDAASKPPIAASENETRSMLPHSEPVAA